MNPEMLGPICAFLSSVTWAIGSANYSKMSRTQSAFQVNLSRALFALPLFIIGAFISAGGLEEGLRSFFQVKLENIGWLSISMLSSYALGDVFFFWSTVSLGVPGALAIASVYPLLMALFSYFALGSPMSAVQWSGLLLAIAGIITVILSNPAKVRAEAGERLDHPAASKVLDEESEITRKTVIDRVSWRERKGFGIVLALSTALCWATNTYSVSQGSLGMNIMVIGSVRMTLALFLSSLLGLAISGQRPRLITAASWKKYGWVFLIESFGGSLFFVYGLAHSDLVLASVLTSLAPVLAVPLAIILGLERFSVARTLGVVAVVSGLSLL